jgi:hypothetical protein
MDTGSGIDLIGTSDVPRNSVLEPAALISLAANLTPSRMLTPIDADPPVNGPDTPILIESAAKTGAVIMLAVMSQANFIFIRRSPLFMQRCPSFYDDQLIYGRTLGSD